MGKVEGTDSSEGDSFSLRVFCGKRVASISAVKGVDPVMLAERAVAMAKVAPEDPYAGLAPRERLATSFSGPGPSRPHGRFTRGPRPGCPGHGSGGSCRARRDQLRRLISQRWTGRHGSGHLRRIFRIEHAIQLWRGISVVAGEGVKMQRDYDGCSRIHFADLDSVDVIGRKAAERAVRRLNPVKAKTGPVNVVLDPRVARGFAGHLAGAINGASVARKTSFLKDRMGEQILAPASP